LKNVYFISGLGADHRAFSFLDLSFCHPVHIEWIPPNPGESLQHYALRLRTTIPESAPTIVGLSFGGMLLCEMAKHDNKMIGLMISSIKQSSELPGYYRLLEYLPIYKILPAPFLKRIAIFLRFLFGVTDKYRQLVLKEMIAATDPYFLKWSISAIVGWRNTVKPANIINIHGTHDRILPYRNVKADITLKNGTHMMPFNNVEEITGFLQTHVSR
jgi:Alpha/beta hydrolase family